MNTLDRLIQLEKEVCGAERKIIATNAFPALLKVAKAARDLHYYLKWGECNDSIASAIKNVEQSLKQLDVTDWDNKND